MLAGLSKQRRPNHDLATEVSALRHRQRRRSDRGRG